MSIDHIVLNVMGNGHKINGKKQNIVTNVVNHQRLVLISRYVELVSIGLTIDMLTFLLTNFLPLYMTRRYETVHFVANII